MEPRNRSRSAAWSVLATVALAAACTPASVFRRTNEALQPPQVAADRVVVLASAAGLSPDWVELGRYRGRANDRAAAVLRARATCGEHGATHFVVHERRRVRLGWEVAGVCIWIRPDRRPGDDAGTGSGSSARNASSLAPTTYGPCRSSGVG